MIKKFLPTRFIIILSCLVLTACSLFPCKCISEELVSNTSNSHSCCNKGNSQKDKEEHHDKNPCRGCLIGAPIAAESFLTTAQVKTLGFAPILIPPFNLKHLNIAFIGAVVLPTNFMNLVPRLSSDLPTLLHRWLI